MPPIKEVFKILQTLCIQFDLSEEYYDQKIYTIDNVH